VADGYCLNVSEAHGVRRAASIIVVEIRQREELCVDGADPALRIDHVVARQVSGDEGGVLREVLERNVDALYRFIVVRVRGDRDAADDLLQQTCCEAARHGRPPADENECLAWLHGIARNLVRQHWRKRTRASVLVPLEDHGLAAALVETLETRQLPVEAAVRQEEIEQLLLAVTSLSIGDQALISAYYFAGRAQAEIAAELGVSERSVESRLFRARARMRAVLRNGKGLGGA